MVQVQYKILPHGISDFEFKYGTDQSACVDLPAAVEEDKVLAPGERAIVPTGLALAFPHGFVARIYGRSGLAAKQGIAILGGVIDADYRGDYGVIMLNTSSQPVTIKRGERVAQLAIVELPPVEFIKVDELNETSRGTGSFGHTGK